MKHFFKKNLKWVWKQRGFVLPFTLLICAIMLLISIGISSVLVKQITFSGLSRDSQIAYFAADNALACALSVEETYSYNGAGLFLSDPSLVNDWAADVDSKIDSIRLLRENNDPQLFPLAIKRADIQCGQSYIFDTTPSGSDFTVSNIPFARVVPDTGDTEYGVTTSFKMKMKIDDSTFRCAKVTVNKTATYKQIIAQGYSRCNQSSGTIERAVVYSTVQ